MELKYREFVVGSLADLDADILEKVLSVVYRIKSEIFTVVKQEASHNGLQFLGRFTESLHYYSTLFDSLNSTGVDCSEEDQIMTEMYLGHQISNVVGCNGSDRVERHERLIDWRNRLRSGGFNPVCLESLVSIPIGFSVAPRGKRGRRRR